MNVKKYIEVDQCKVMSDIKKNFLKKEKFFRKTWLLVITQESRKNV